jgi:hypothetical protein
MKETDKFHEGAMEALNEYEAKVKALREDIMAKILSLPDNPHIHRLGPHCFVMSSRYLSNANWLPIYYDYKQQYRFVAALIEHYEPTTLKARIDKILTDGQLRVPSDLTVDGEHLRGGEMIYFHPDVLEHLRKAL